ncbi:MAG: PPC domain-containing protein [Aggregatilineales bacterium]
MILFKRLFMLLIAALATGASVVAQSVDTIAIGETKTGVVTGDNPAPSYFFDIAAATTLTIQLTTPSVELRPVILVADSRNTVLATLSAPPGAASAGGAITLAEAGRYFIQVQGAGGTQGPFSVSLLEGDVPLAAPAESAGPPLAEQLLPARAPVLPLAVDARPDLTAATLLSAGMSVTGAVSAETPELLYTLDLDDGALAVQVRAEGDAPSRLSAALELVETGATIALIGPPAFAGTFAVAPGDAVLLRLRHNGGDPQPYALRVSLFDEQALALPMPVSPAAPAVTPTPLPPEAVELLLRWDPTYFLMTNISGRSLNVSGLSFSGANRSATMDVLAQTSTAFNPIAFPPGACIGFRPLAYPSAPPAGSCRNLAAWYSADIYYFWGAATFDVLLNGTRIAMCETVVGECGIALR